MPIDSDWSVGSRITAARLNRINRTGLVTEVAPSEDGTVKLATAGVNYAGPNTFVVITLAEAARVRVDAQLGLYISSNVFGRYAAQLGYNAGFSPGSPTLFGPQTLRTLSVSTFESVWVHATVVMFPGTWRLYPVVGRAGGATADAIQTGSYVAATILGAI